MNITRFQVVGPYESPFAGLMMLKIDARSGKSWITTGPPQGVALEGWEAALGNIYWTPIADPDSERDLTVPEAQYRYELCGPVAFGDFHPNADRARKRHAAARIHTLTGATWILVRSDDGKLSFPFHDEFEGLVWKRIEEAAGSLRKGAYSLQPLVNANQVALRGQTLGPVLVRTDRDSGDTWIASWRGAGRGDTDLIWKPIGIR